MNEKEKNYNKEEKLKETIVGNQDKKNNYNKLKWVALGLIGLAILFFVFGFGVFIGGLRARFSYRWAESYHQNFAGPRGGFFGNWRGLIPLPGDFLESHGVFGEIIEIDEWELVVQDRDNIERIVVIDEDTVIQKRKNQIKKENLKISNCIVVIGSSNEQGKIEAKIVRVFNGNGEEGMFRPKLKFKLF